MPAGVRRASSRRRRRPVRRAPPWQAAALPVRRPASGVRRRALSPPAPSAPGAALSLSLSLSPPYPLPRSSGAGMPAARPRFIPRPMPAPFPLPCRDRSPALSPSAWNKGAPFPRPPPPLKLIYFSLYSLPRFPLFGCPMQHLKDALTAAALTFLAWFVAVCFLSL